MAAGWQDLTYADHATNKLFLVSQDVCMTAMLWLFT